MNDFKVEQLIFKRSGLRGIGGESSNSRLRFIVVVYHVWFDLFFLWEFVFPCVCVWEYVCVWVCARMSWCMSVCVCVHVWVCMWECVTVYAWLCILVTFTIIQKENMNIHDLIQKNLHFRPALQNLWCIIDGSSQDWRLIARGEPFEFCNVRLIDEYPSYLFMIFYRLYIRICNEYIIKTFNL